MRDRKISALPVIRGSEVVGLITESDILRAFISMLDSPVRRARVTFDASNDDDVFALIAECAQGTACEYWALSLAGSTTGRSASFASRARPSTNCSTTCEPRNIRC
jgi:hypothetical protein